MRTRTERFLPFALLLPTIAFLTLLIVIPMVQALLLSVMAESGGLTLDNFQRMLADVNFSEAWRNTLLLLILIVPLQIANALTSEVGLHDIGFAAAQALGMIVIVTVVTALYSVLQRRTSRWLQ